MRHCYLATTHSAAHLNFYFRPNRVLVFSTVIARSRESIQWLKRVKTDEKKNEDETSDPKTTNTESVSDFVKSIKVRD